MDVLAGLEALVLLAGEDLEGVGAEEVALALEEVGRERLGPVAVKEREGGRMGRDREAPDGRLGDDPPPAGLGVGDGLGEELVEQEVLELGVLLVSGGDVTKEDTVVVEC